MKLFVRTLVGAMFLAALAAPASASPQVYHFANPTFGGNPLNGTFLLGTAQGQGFGAQSGANSPDLTGLDNALSNLGTSLGGATGDSGSGTVIVIPEDP